MSVRPAEPEEKAIEPEKPGSDYCPRCGFFMGGEVGEPDMDEEILGEQPIEQPDFIAALRRRRK